MKRSGLRTDQRFLKQRMRIALRRLKKEREEKQSCMEAVGCSAGMCRGLLRGGAKGSQGSGILPRRARS